MNYSKNKYFTVYLFYNSIILSKLGVYILIIINYLLKNCILHDALQVRAQNLSSGP
jgi:hypothetical protein